jgi:hypothetical protein
MRDFSSVRPATEISGDDEDDTILLRQMHASARAYLASHEWCAEIRKEYYGFGIGGIVSVFLFQISPKQREVDEWLWVVVGDVPSAYFVTDEASNPTQALQVYVSLMREWIEAVRTGGSLDEVYPVRAEATPDNASALESRLNYIETDILRERHA